MGGRAGKRLRALRLWRSEWCEIGSKRLPAGDGGPEVELHYEVDFDEADVVEPIELIEEAFVDVVAFLFGVCETIDVAGLPVVEAGAPGGLVIE
jgi:hypothetical protein